MRSMTGFGRADGAIGNVHYTLEIKSVNHRYLDVRFRAPSSLSQFEILLTDTLRALFTRGSFEISVRPKLSSAQPVVHGGTRFVVDETAAKSLLEGIKWLHEQWQTPKTPSLEFLAATGRVFIAVEDVTEPAQISAPLQALFNQAAGELKKMREAEGARLKAFLKDGIRQLKEATAQIAQNAASHPKAVEERLRQRIQNWQLASSVDKQRLEWEVAFYADRADITEEIQRLKSHTEAFEKQMDQGGAIGRKLDFLTQEMHREVNTISSKTPVTEITRLTVEAKTLVEKLREQVQNVE